MADMTRLRTRAACGKGTGPSALPRRLLGPSLRLGTVPLPRRSPPAPPGLQGPFSRLPDPSQAEPLDTPYRPGLTLPPRDWKASQFNTLSTL